MWCLITSVAYTLAFSKMLILTGSQTNKHKGQGSALHALLGQFIITLACQRSGMFTVIRTKCSSPNVMLVKAKKWQSGELHVNYVRAYSTILPRILRKKKKNTSSKHANFAANQKKGIQITAVSINFSQRTQIKKEKTFWDRHAPSPKAAHRQYSRVSSRDIARALHHCRLHGKWLYDS